MDRWMTCDFTAILHPTQKYFSNQDDQGGDHERLSFADEKTSVSRGSQTWARKLSRPGLNPLSYKAFSLIYEIRLLPVMFVHTTTPGLESVRPDGVLRKIRPNGVLIGWLVVLGLKAL